MAFLFLLLLIPLLGVILACILVPLLTLINGDKQASAVLAVMVWILLSMLIISYGQLLPGFDGGIRERGSERGEGKLQTAPFRLAFIHGAISSHCLAVAGLSDTWLWPIVALLIAAGYFLGRDYRDRVFALRKRYHNQINKGADGRDHFYAFESTEQIHISSLGKDD
ncbi:MAG TPA: hypothetical protein VGM98_15520 [Schlesneria sp.]|jgi:hypothetical protein